MRGCEADSCRRLGLICFAIACFVLAACGDDRREPMVIVPSGGAGGSEAPDGAAPDGGVPRDGCVPQCDGKQCGDDGCGGSCGACGDGRVCDASQRCACEPQCDGRACGDDGCGGSCGACAEGTVCGVGGACECIPSCSGKQCGDDGCGGECPDTCIGAQTCRYRTGTCMAGPCVPDCDGRDCGSDDCGGTCGASEGACAPGDGCNSAGMCECQPSCEGKACGDDGCGGTCGSCGGAASCEDGACVAASATTAEVLAIFDSKGCGSGGCHGGARPSQGISLDSTSGIESSLVGVASEQCTNKLLVAAGDPAASYLVNKLTGAGMCGGSQMPKGAPPLSSAQLDTIRAWISGL